MRDASSGAAIAVEPGQRQLFLDDYCIAKAEGLVATMHQPDKKGAVIRPEQPWERFIQTRCMPAWDERVGKFKLWAFSDGQMNYLESGDGIHWDRPMLGQKQYNGSWENNIVTPDPKLEWPHNAMENIVLDPDDPDENRRYKGFLGCIDRRPVFSPDGVHWRRADDFLLPSADESNLSYDRQSGTFIASLKGNGPHGRAHNIWVSRNFRDWTHVSQFAADDEDQRLGNIHIERRLSDPAVKRPYYNIPHTYNVDIYNLGLFRYEGLYIGMPSVYHQTGKVTGSWEGFDRLDMPAEDRAIYKRDGDWSGFHHVQLASSRDLQRWNRLGGRRPFLDLSPLDRGAYDLETIMPPSGPVVRGNELWFYYSGLPCYGGNFAYGEHGNAICLAVLRRDGFVSLDAEDGKTGTLLTKSFVSCGGRLHVNADASGGMLGAVLLDEDNRTIAEAAPVVADDPAHEIRWIADGGAAATAEGKTVKIRFALNRARLYSFWFDK